MSRVTFEGGINENDGAAVQECQEGQNFDLEYRSANLRPRRPIDLADTEETTAGTIAGIMQLIKRDDSETTLVFSDDSGGTPTVYSWDGSSFTSVRTDHIFTGSKFRDTYWSLDDIIVITDIELNTPLFKWDGTTYSRLRTNLAEGSPTNIGTDLTSVGTTATVDHGSAHGLVEGDLVIIADAVQTEYNGEYEITAATTNTFDYEFAGSVTSPATGTPTFDKDIEVYAKYAVVHNGRMWLFNIKTVSSSGTDLYPHMALVSAFEDAEDYDIAATGRGAAQSSNTFTTGLEAFYLLTPDLKPINGVSVFNKQLIISTDKGRLYRLTGSSAGDFNFIDYYAGSAAQGTECMANIGNDVIYMKQNGIVETLLATEASSDVSTDDVSRWIPDLVSDVTDAIAVYDQTLQNVYFFTNATNKVLVLSKDHYNDPEFQLSPWTRYKTMLTESFATSAARYMRVPGGTDYCVYFGGTGGRIYRMNGSGTGDNSNDIVLTRKTRVIDEIDRNTEILTGEVRYRRIGECEITLYFDWADYYNQTSSTITLSGPPSDDAGIYFGGDFYFNGSSEYFNLGNEFAEKVSTRNFSPAGRSHAFTMEIYSSATVRFRIDHIEI